ncbi:MAG: DNA-directed RNA polymerase subunit D [Candidatus Altiarchaeales archaeon]|nr:DNA-directed RNA polymerase subunit D [Candidatus Altiarchaeales archaeon]
MKIKNLKQEGNTITFNVKDADTTLLNALRRTILSEIPVMAIETVTFYNNTSILSDELLAHRLGLVPLITDPKLFNNPPDCSCKGKGCGKCTLKITLKAEGPKTVYSSELQPADKETKPVYENMPLVKLTAGQQIDLEAIAHLGQAKDHTKWQAGLASYEEKEDGSYDMQIETYSQLSVKTLLEQAFNTFEEKLKQLKEELK